MTDEEIIAIAVKTSLLNYIDNETPRRFFVSSHAELEDVVNFGRIIAATASGKASNAIRAELEKLNSQLTDALTDLSSARQDNASLTEGYKTARAKVERLQAALGRTERRLHRLEEALAHVVGEDNSND